MAAPQNKTISVIAHEVSCKGFISITGVVISKNMRPAKTKYSGHGFHQFQNKRSVTVVLLTEMVSSVPTPSTPTSPLSTAPPLLEQLDVPMFLIVPSSRLRCLHRHELVDACLSAFQIVVHW